MAIWTTPLNITEKHEGGEKIVLIQYKLITHTGSLPSGFVNALPNVIAR